MQPGTRSLSAADRARAIQIDDYAQKLINNDVSDSTFFASLIMYVPFIRELFEKIDEHELLGLFNELPAFKKLAQAATHPYTD